MNATRNSLRACLLVAVAALPGCDSGTQPGDNLVSPRLLGPVENDSFPALSLVEFSWNSVDGASAYEIALEYAEYPSSSYSEITTDTVHVAALTELGPASWRVRARSTEAPGSWSESRALDVFGTHAMTVAEFDFVFSTQDMAVGQDLTVAASSTFAPPLTAVIQASGASPIDLRDIEIDEFRVTVDNPAGTTLDDFSEWAILLSTDSVEALVMSLSDPAPALETTGASFQQPEDWPAPAVDPDTRMILSLKTNPRTPRATDVHVRVRLEMTAVLNYWR